MTYERNKKDQRIPNCINVHIMTHSKKTIHPLVGLMLVPFNRRLARMSNKQTR